MAFPTSDRIASQSGLPVGSLRRAGLSRRRAGLSLRQAGLAAVCLVVAAPAAAQWPRFLNTGFDGRATEEVRIDWSAAPRFRWGLAVGEGYGLGAVSGGRYYAFDSHVDGDRGRRERLRAVSMETGRVEWSVDRPLIYRDLYGYEPGPRSAPTVVGDRIVTLGVAGELCCRSLSDGSLVWGVDTSGEYGVVQNFFGVGGSPLVLDDRVIVMVGGSPEADRRLPPGRIERASPDGSLLVAFGLQDGRELWRAGQDLASYSSPRPIELEGQTFVLIFARDQLVLVDPDQGQVRWAFPHRADLVESVNAIVPVVDDDLVFISECYQVGGALLRVTPDDYQVVWQDPPFDRRSQAMRSHWATPNLIGGFLYGCSGRNSPDSDFRCVDFRSGEVTWVDPQRTRSSATAVGDVLVQHEERGKLRVLRADPRALDVIAEWDLSRPEGQRPALAYPCWSAPIVVGDRMLVRGDTQVLCLELPTAP